MTDEYMDRQIGEQTTKNIELASRFTAEALENEHLLESIPEGRPLIFVTAEDPELSRLNFEMAVRELFKGRAPVLVRVGGPSPETEAWKAADRRHLAMEQIRFPSEPMQAADVRVVYDQGRDLLMVDYFGGRRPHQLLEVGPHIILRIDPENHEIVGYLVASYLQVEAFRSPVLARALRKAEVRAITDEELGEVTIQRERETPFDDEEAAAVASEFVRWIAPRRNRPDLARDSA